MPQNVNFMNTSSSSNYILPQNPRIEQYNVGDRSIIISSWTKPSLG